MVLDRKNKIVAKHAKGVEFLMKKNKVDWIKGYATLRARARSKCTATEGKQTLEAKNIIHRDGFGSAHAARTAARSRNAS